MVAKQTCRLQGDNRLKDVVKSLRRGSRLDLLEQCEILLVSLVVSCQKNPRNWQIGILL